MEGLPQIIETVQLPVHIQVHPYLLDHRFEGKAVLPAVETMQLLANTVKSFRPITDITGITVLRCLMKLEMAEIADPVLRLAALLRPGAAVARTVAERLRLSNAETAELAMLDAPPAELQGAAAVLSQGIEAPEPRRALTVALYRFGTAKLRQSLAIAQARLLAEAPDRAAPGALAAALQVAEAWQARRFPLSGADVLGLGVASGPAVGELLRAVEDWWIDEDFAPDRAACLGRLRELAAPVLPQPPRAPGS